MDIDGKKTLVEEGTEFKGSLKSRCPVEVRGRVEGDLDAPSLHVTDSGAVSGKVRVTDLVSHGEIAGELDAEAAHLSGTVKDNTVVRAKTLEVKLGAPNGNKLQVIFGEVTLDVGDAPREPAAAGKKKRAKDDDKEEAATSPDNGKSVPPPGE